RPDHPRQRPTARGAARLLSRRGRRADAGAPSRRCRGARLPRSRQRATRPGSRARARAGSGAPGGVPADALIGLGGPATTGAPPAAGRHPVLLLSHGLGSSTALLTAHATDLASHGYVVVGIDHPGDALPVDIGGGRIVNPDPRGIRIVD